MEREESGRPKEAPSSIRRTGPVQPRTVAPRADAEILARVERLLRGSGPRAALEYLNQRTRFRFTGIYQADPPVLRNLILVDRENPSLDASGAVCPLDETYCAITCAREALFRTIDAPNDPRLVSHPARDSVISYAGVPLRLADGRAWGTLCHFDLRPRLLPAAELRLLEAVAPDFAARLERVHGLSRGS